MSKIDVNLYKFGDWQVLKIDGETVSEGHKIEIEEFAKHLNLEDYGIVFRSKLIEENDYPELAEYFYNGDVETIIDEI